jgi:Ca2+-binding EF-hand superfamily protein
MKQIAAASAALLASMTMGAAFAQTDMPSWTQNRSTMDSRLDAQFNAMDNSQDGQVSKSEYDTYWKRQFANADANDNGKLDKSEARDAAKQINGGTVATANGFDQMWKQVSDNGVATRQSDMAYHDRLFKQADIDNSGSLSKNEMQRALSAHDLSVASL